MVVSTCFGNNTERNFLDEETNDGSMYLSYVKEETRTKRR